MPDDMLLVQFRMPKVPATLDEAAKRLGVAQTDFDAAYGLVEVDPADRLFTVRIPASKESTVKAALGDADPAEGVFSDPRIEPF
ncbi:MAG: hypothetical protein R3E44_00415 [Paracoccaceae bacterium]